MLKFIAVQLVDDQDVKGMIYIIRQSEIKRNTLLTPNPQLVPHQPQYYSQSCYSHTSNAIQNTFFFIINKE